MRHWRVQAGHWMSHTPVLVIHDLAERLLGVLWLQAITAAARAFLLEQSDYNI